MPPKLTDRDREIAAAVWQCFKGGEPQIDYEKLATVAGFKNSHSAAAYWHPIKKKLLAGAGSASDGGAKGSDGNEDDQPSAKKRKAKASTKKRKLPSEDGDGDVVKPTKKRGSKAEVKKTAKKEDKEDTPAIGGFENGTIKMEQADDGEHALV